ncbi:MAG: GNAT family N-acetyltransferase [Clostridia bacterium]
MKYRLANLNDLPKLKSFFKDVVKDMYKNNITIWGDYYPYEVLHIDINLNRLYILHENEKFISVFALCREEGQKEYVNWKDKNANALYIYRLAVHPDLLGKSIATVVINYALELTKQFQCEYLRLLVVDNNLPALKLYEKINFNLVTGTYKQTMHDGVVLTEYGFEKKIV